MIMNHKRFFFYLIGFLAECLFSKVVKVHTLKRLNDFSWFVYWIILAGNRNLGEGKYKGVGAMYLRSN